MLKSKPIVGSKEQGRTHYFLVLDRSGSMSYDINSVVEDAKKLIDRMDGGDLVSFGWFSGRGQWGWVFDGVMVNPNNVSTLKREADALKSTIGLTCFNEVLTSISTTADATNVLLFLTDGYHNTGSVKAIEDSLNGKFDYALFVGYGRYYDRAMLLRMAEWANGAFTDAQNVEEFSFAAENMQANVSPKLVLEVEPGSIIAFYITNNGPVEVPIIDDRVQVPGKAKEVYFGDGNVGGDYEENASAALLAIRKNDVNKALEYLAFLEDKYLLDLVNNSFSDAEWADTEKAITEAVSDARYRYLNGKGSQPDKDAFSIMDALELLLNDKFAAVDLNQLSYKRIGAKSEPKDGMASFKRTQQWWPINNLTFNSSRANVSLGGPEEGVITLPDGSTLNGIQFRNRTVIKDGRLNCNFPIKSTKKVFEALKKAGAAYGKWEKDVAYNVEFGNLPTINRATAEKCGSLDDFVYLLETELGLQAEQKVVKYMKDQMSPKVDSGPYAEFGVKQTGSGYVYSPQTSSVKGNDIYIAKTVKAYKKGVSSLPSVAAAIAKGYKGGKGQQMLYQALADLSYKIKGPKGVDVSKLDEIFQMNNEELQRVRFQIAKFVMAIVVGGVWFPELKDTNEYQGWKFERKEVEVSL